MTMPFSGRDLTFAAALEGLEIAAEVEQASGLEAALAANPCDILLLDLQMEQWSMDQIADLSARRRSSF